MKESRFIAQNKQKWEESETLLSGTEKDPEKLTNLFTQVVDDLSFSRTYYPNRSVRVYLNQLAREYFSLIYQNTKSKKNALRLFWLDEMPQLMIFARKPMLISLLVFLLAAGVGVFSSINDPQFSSAILGERYVAMTKENIKNGDPMAVYKSGREVSMFLGITINNLQIAFATYVLGAFFAIGTLYILLSNGIMVGCFQYFFVEHGLLAKSASTIWLHGTLEISSIILSGGAGLVLGSGLLFPGTYSRFQSFQISAVRSLKIMLGVAPIFVIAAIIESFLSRYSNAPDILKASLIVLSAAFIVGYFIIYPWRKSKSGFEVPLTETRVAPERREKVIYETIRNNAAVLQEVFHFYRRQLNKFLPLILVVSAALALWRLYFDRGRLIRMPDKFGIQDMFLAISTPNPWFILVNTLGTSIILYRLSDLMKRELLGVAKNKFQLQSFIQIIVIVAPWYLLLFWSSILGGILLGCVFMYTFILSYIQQHDNTSLTRAIGDFFRLKGGGQTFGLGLILLLMMLSFLLILSAPLPELLISSLESNFAGTGWVLQVVEFIRLFIHFFVFNMIVPLIVASAAFQFFSLKEIQTADKLTEAISKLGDNITKRAKR